jgi:hypothetical protein
MAKEAGPYRIVGDDSGHKYVIPIARETHWEKWVGSEAWADGDVPDYAECIDGTFQILDYSTRATPVSLSDELRASFRS